jgi:DNA-binding NarL/FixJ family response regulator
MTRRSPTIVPAETGSHAQKAPARDTEARAAQPRLTAREVDVIELAMLGLTNSQIAERLNLSTYAIKFHLSSAYGKLGVANRTQAAVAYLDLRRGGRP